jgi:Uma2 family endonuclease
MSEAAWTAPMTLADFLAWENNQPERFERVGGVVRMMAGGTEAHDSIETSLKAVLAQRLRGSGCRVHGPNLKVISPRRDLLYPDLFIRCGVLDPTATSRDDPIIVIEILSKSTAQHDLTRKKHAYQTIASVQRIVYVAQNEARLDIVVRDADGRWHDEVVSGLEGELVLPELGLSVPMAEIYAEIEFTAARESSE